MVAKRVSFAIFNTKLCCLLVFLLIDAKTMWVLRNLIVEQLLCSGWERYDRGDEFLVDVQLRLVCELYPDTS